MSRESPNILEKLVSGARRIVSKGKKYLLMTSVAGSFGAVGPCDVGGGGFDPEKEAVSAKAYQNSIGYWVPHNIAPEDASTEMMDWTTEVANDAILEKMLAFVSAPSFVGPLASFIRDIDSAGNSPSTSIYVKKRNSPNWVKNTQISEDEEVLVMMQFNQGDQLSYFNCIKAEIIDKTGSVDRTVGYIEFLEPEEETSTTAPNFLVRKYATTFTKFMPNAYFNGFTNPVFQIGGGNPANVTIILQDDFGNNSGGNGGSNSGNNGSGENNSDSRIYESTITANQSAFATDRNPEAFKNFAFFDPLPLRCGISDWDNVKGEILETQDSIPYWTFIDFKGIEDYRNDTITEAKIVVSLYEDNQMQGDLPFRVAISPIFAPWSENSVNEGFLGAPLGYHVITPTYGKFTSSQNSPFSQIVFDISDLVYEDRSEYPKKSKKWIDNPTPYGFALYPVDVYPEGHDYTSNWREENFRTFWSSRSEHPPELRIKHKE